LAWWLQGPRLFESLHEPRQYLRHKAIVETTAALRDFAPLLLLWGIALARGRIGERLGFASFYLLIALPVAVFASGGDGVDVNAFFDVLIAASLVAGLALEKLLGEASGPRGGPDSWRGLAACTCGVAACVLALWLAGYAIALAPLQIELIHRIDADEQAALQDIDLIRKNGDGRAACQMMGLCYWAGSAFTVDFFYFGQQLKTNTLPPSACAQAFDGSAVSMVQLHSNPRFRAKLLPAYCEQLIDRQYHLIHESSFGPLLISAASATRSR
jgi:hypothetical protein